MMRMKAQGLREKNLLKRLRSKNPSTALRACKQILTATYGEPREYRPPMAQNPHEAERAQHLLSKVIPFEIWNAGNTKSPEQIKDYWFVVNSFKQVAQPQANSDQRRSPAHGFEFGLFNGEFNGRTDDAI